MDVTEDVLPEVVTVGCSRPSCATVDIERILSVCLPRCYLDTWACLVVDEFHGGQQVAIVRHDNDDVVLVGDGVFYRLYHQVHVTALFVCAESSVGKKAVFQVTRSDFAQLRLIPLGGVLVEATCSLRLVFRVGTSAEDVHLRELRREVAQADDMFRQCYGIKNARVGGGTEREERFSGVASSVFVVDEDCHAFRRFRSIGFRCSFGGIKLCRHVRWQHPHSPKLKNLANPLYEGTARNNDLNIPQIHGNASGAEAGRASVHVHRRVVAAPAGDQLVGVDTATHLVVLARGGAVRGDGRRQG